MSTNDPLTRRHLTVRGRVQGVGFRCFAQETAESLGLTGWVRNREDGAVEAEAQGTVEVIDEFVERLKTVHPVARVDLIETRSVAVRSETSFRII